MKESIGVAEARDLILASTDRLAPEAVPLSQALGRVLAEAVESPWALPPFDNTAMDGFAVRALDTQGASFDRPVALDVVDKLPAGRFPTRAIGAGEAIRIMTGAPLPPGADAIVKVEDTRSDDRRVLVLKAASTGDHVRRAGEDVACGERVFEPGTVLSPAAIGMLASLGRATVGVHRRPRVAVLSTGDELVDVGGDRRDGTIIASNLYSLAAQVQECGALPVILGIAKDDPRAIEAKLREATACDVILTTGGVSVGDYDFVKDVLRDVGGEMHFWRVRMKPGHPLLYGHLGSSAIFGLPGNPVSCMVSFEQFVRPALLRSMGHRLLFRPRVRARLTAPLRQKKGRTTFLRAIVRRDGDGWSVSTTGNQSSGALSSMVKANGLLVFPAESEELPAGALVEVQMIDPAWLSAADDPSHRPPLPPG